MLARWLRHVGTALQHQMMVGTAAQLVERSLGEGLDRPERRRHPHDSDATVGGHRRPKVVEKSVR
jgi:hypothetical protein